MDVVVGLFAALLATVGSAVAPAPTAPAPAPAPAVAPAAPAPAGDVPVFGDWRTFTSADGLPGDKVTYVRAQGDKVIWVGTEHGLARIDGEKVVEVIGTEDGLVHRAVLSIDAQPDGELWVGTMGGVTHISAGRVESFTQFNSGLPNDVVFSVANCGRDIWAATTSGLGRYDTWTRSWKVYDEKNAPMHEIWGYFVSCAHPKYVYAAVWGGGILEFDPEHEHWKDYRDPDGELEIDLFRDDGLIHVITTSVDYADGILWASTYFGMSTYDGRDWRGYMDHDSGLAGNFINMLRAAGKAAWIATDSGLSWFDRKTWVTYTRKEDGTGDVRIGFGPKARHIATKTAIAHNFIFSVDQQGDTVWIATGKGLSRGRLTPGLAARAK